MAFKRSLAFTLCSSIALAAAVPAYATPPPLPLPPATVAPPPAAAPSESPAELQRLVAPIALYPDPLVAQILAAATYPAQVVEAHRWMTQHAGLVGAALRDAVNLQPWDPSVKAITAFPSVLANMDRNLAWTSSLGQAYVEQPQAVVDAIQVMRRRAQSAGNLGSSSQEIVVTQGQTISIEPSNPDMVYVPEYDPWLVYGPPLVAWPDWYAYPGLYLDTPGIIFGFGFGIAAWASFGWGWHHWGLNWHQRRLEFDHHAFISRDAPLIDHHFAGGFHHPAGGFGHFGGGVGHVAGGFDHFGGGIGHAAGGFDHFDGDIGHAAGGIDHFDGGIGRVAGGFQHFGGGFQHVAGGFHPVGGFQHFGGFQHVAGGFHGGGFHGGGFHGGGFHGGGFGGGGRR